MHHALYLEEILLQIFGYCHSSANPSPTTERALSAVNLAALARTCRAFKEPALDMLWSELVDLSPLAFCLPEGRRTSGKCYSFATPRNDAEWNTLKSYTRRVRHIASFSSPNGCLDQSCISATFDSPLPEPLFPNLRRLIWQGGPATLPALNFAAPTLTSLDIRGNPGEDVSRYTHILDTIVPRCPNIKNIRIQVAGDIHFFDTVSHHLRSWPKLCVVDLLDVALPISVILYLAHIPTLAWLSFILDPHVPDLTIPTADTAHVFTRLAYLEIVSGSIATVTDLLARVRLPVAQTLIVPFPNRPSRTAVRSYLATAVDACAHDVLMDLRLLNLRSFTAPIWLAARSRGTPTPNAVVVVEADRAEAVPRLDFDDLAPCMAFSNLRGVHVNLEWPVALTDRDVLALVGAWPRLEHLLINDQWGWRVSAAGGGITFHGLLRVLQCCRWLQEVCVALDTRSAVAFAREDAEGFVLQTPFWINVADSVLEPQTVPAVWTALSALGFSARHVLAWSGSQMRDIPGADTYTSRWMRLFR